jgi:hypothetical protein
VLQRNLVVNDRIFLSLGDIALGRDKVERVRFRCAGITGQRHLAKCHAIFRVRVYIVVDVDGTGDTLRLSSNRLLVRRSLSPISRSIGSGRELQALQFAVKELNRLALLLEFLKFTDHNVFADLRNHRLHFRT